MEKIACFIHSTNLNLWKDTVLIKMLDSLKDNGLLQKLKHLCIVNTGNRLDTTEIEKKYAPAKIVNWSKNTMEFEICTIKQVVTYAKLHPDTRILYMHTKGISYTKEHVFVPGIQAWIDYMLHVLVTNHEKCLKLLQLYDTVGCNFRPDENGNMQHYSGNFWWVRADYVQHLPVENMKDKYEPEFWVLQNRPFLFNVHKIEHMYEQAYPLENYKECVDRGFDDNVFFCKLGFHQTGLCNQLYCLANVITAASLQHGNKVIILDDFITEILSNNTKPSKYVIDLDALNERLLSDKIHVFYKNDIKMELIKVQYGLKELQTIDITTKVIDKFWEENRLFIPQGYSLNDLCDKDPCPGLRKQLYVYYTLNGVHLMKTFHERVLVHCSPIEIKHTNYDGKMSYYVNLPHAEPWLTLIDRDTSKDMKTAFDKYLTQIPFLPLYDEMATSFLETVNAVGKKISILHIRNEDDAISHWSKRNNMTEDEYREKYERQFLQAVNENVSKEDLCIALTFLTKNNRIIEKLQESGYNIVCRDNIENIGREMNALIDLMLCKTCDHTFVGNFDPVSMQGSTYSVFIYNFLSQNTSVKKVIVDVEHIDRETFFVS